VELTADCSRCVGLCCVLLRFQRSADFAFDKAAGEPCRHLVGEHRCRIHDRLLDDGMRGCVAYDCFGAGQAVTQTLRVESFHEVEQLHEIAWYLTEALHRGVSADSLLAETEALAAAPRPTAAEVGDLRSRVVPVLGAVAEQARSSYDAPLAAAGNDLVGADLRGEDLRGADLHAALLIEADLRGVDLTDTDLLGADLRGARLALADLSSALFLTRRQLGSASSGPAREGLPPRLRA